MSTVATSWKSIRKWIEKNAPEFDAAFDKGVRAAELRAFEKVIGRRLPADFADSLKKHTRAKGVFPAPDRDWPEMAYSIMNLDHIHDQWQMMNGLYDSGEFDDRHEGTKTTKGVVQQWWVPYWLPFADNGGGDFLCVDLSPTYPGRLGQVLWVAHENSIRPCLAKSMDSFLQQIAVGFSAGHYTLHKHYRFVRSHVRYFPRSKLK